MRTRPASRRTLPSTTASMSSSRAMAETGSFRSRRLIADVRETTRSFVSWASRAVISSVRPAAKNSWAGSAERFSSGRTTTDLISGRAASRDWPLCRTASQPPITTATRTIPTTAKRQCSPPLGADAGAETRLGADAVGAGGHLTAAPTRRPPRVHLVSKRVHRSELVVLLPVDRQPLASLPALDRADVASEVCRNLLPRVQTTATRIQLGRARSVLVPRSARASALLC